MGSLRKFLVVGLLLALVLFAIGCNSGGNTSDTSGSGTGTEEPASKTAEGTLYIAGMGGHFAKADMKFDPENSENPFEVTSLSRVTLGPAESHATHDVRIDSSDRNTVYSAAYVRDPDGKVHMVKLNLENKEVFKDVSIDPDKRYVEGPMYCASGQSVDMFLPVMMGYEGYIDVVDKETLELKHRVLFDSPEIPKDYVWAHGINTPDMKHFLLTMSATSAEQTNKTVPFPRGTEDLLFYMLDMDALTQGKLEIVKSGKIPGDPAATVVFRQSFTSDGKYLLQSGRDRLMVIDADTLELVDEFIFPKELGSQIEVHDVLPTPDNNYAIAVVRYPVTKAEGDKKAQMDGRLMAYDLKNKKIVGKAVSVCGSCHADMPSLKDKTAILCGADANWKK